MVSSHEDEIYSIMFSSLKHPVRRKILRMLGSKPMTFMEMVEELRVSTPHLVYHLENLGELISKTDNGTYRLSSFGLASISVMKDVEEVRENDPKHHMVTPKWRIASVMLLIGLMILSGVSVVQYYSVNQLFAAQQLLLVENQKLLSGGVSEERVANFLQNVTQIDASNYTVSVLSNTMQWRTDFGGVPETIIQYSLTSSRSNLGINFHFRNNHFAQYELNEMDFPGSPYFVQVQPNDVVKNAKATLARYYTYSGDGYLTNMSNLLEAVNSINDTTIIQGNMKLHVTVSKGTVVFFWMYTEKGIDFQAKGLQMVFQDNILTAMIDGYYLFTVGSTNLATSQDQAVNIVKNYLKTLTWTIGGKEVTGFSVVDPPISVELVPHVRGESVELYPYWYVEMNLNQIYSGGINEVAIGLYADTGQVADVQMLSGSTQT